MLVTPSCIVTLARLKQTQKAPSSILVTLSGIVTLVRLLHLVNASLSILVTLSGMIKKVSVLPAGYATKVFLSLLYKTPLSEVYA
jgi:hypothetical protein